MSLIKAILTGTSANMKSLRRGLYWIISLSVAWLIIAPLLFGLEDRISLTVGIIAIIIAVGISGYGPTPVQHIEVPKIFGERKEDTKKHYNEGPKWLRPGETVETVSAKDKMIDVPIFTVKSINGVPMEIDFAIYYEVENAFVFLNIEEVERRLTKRAKEAARAFVISHTDKECEGAEDNIQKVIEEMIDKRTREECGINITAIDVERIEPVKEVFDEYKKDKQKEIKAERYVKTRDKVKQDADGLTDSEVANLALVVHGDVSKEIKEQKIAHKYEIEPETLDKVAKLELLAQLAQLFPKKKDDSEKRP